MAIRKGNHALARKLYELNPAKCLAPNFKGHNSIFVATQK